MKITSMGKSTLAFHANPKVGSVKAFGPVRGMKLIVLLLLAPISALADESGGGMQYGQCLARAQGDPEAALLLANAWRSKGGGGAAEHCAAVALVGLRRYAEAGASLDSLARSDFATTAATRLELYDQAGNAWLLAGDSGKAITSFSAALSVDPANADVLADRARANALAQRWAKAESDLTAALLVSPNRADLYVLRGSARHAMGRKAEARADIDLALRLQPGFPDALVERGISKFEAGDLAGARGDWQLVVSSAPGSAAAASAQQHLADTATPKP
jgi:tetratricopeptide (TPR) repeat protein